MLEMQAGCRTRHLVLGCRMLGAAPSLQTL